MAEGRTVDPAAAIFDRPFQRPIHGRVSVVSIGEHAHVFRRPTRVVINFQSWSLPGSGHAVMDGVIAEAVDDDVGAAVMPCVFSLTRRDAYDLFALVNRERIALVFFPPANSDHLVVGWPIRKSVVAGVEYQSSTTVADVLLKRDLDFTRPRRSAADIIAGLNHNVVIVELWPPPLPSRRSGGEWRGGN